MNEDAEKYIDLLLNRDYEDSYDRGVWIEAVENAIRDAMHWAYMDAAKICERISDDANEKSDYSGGICVGATDCQRAILERLK